MVVVGFGFPFPSPPRAQASQSADQLISASIVANWLLRRPLVLLKKGEKRDGGIPNEMISIGWPGDRGNCRALPSETGERDREGGRGFFLYRDRACHRVWAMQGSRSSSVRVWPWFGIRVVALGYGR